MSETDTSHESRLADSDYQLLKEKLRELFQMDHADLDFGIYRIMNTKREEIAKYLNEYLPSQIEEAMRTLTSDKTAEIKKEMNRIEQDARKYNGDPQNDDEYRYLAQQLFDDANVSLSKKEIFSDLYAFFSRYYEDGDFLSRRRYKEGVYAIPYAGEEVKLHWANSDQYYIKTAEHFTHYRFLLRRSGKSVHFCIENGSTEQNNNKEGDGKERRFLLLEKSPMTFDKDELVVRFEYRPDTCDSDSREKSSKIENRKQIDINASIVALLKEEIGELNEFAELFEDEDKNGDKGNDRGNGKSTNKCLLERHLHRYTARNQFDYFIHKDLGSFLRRELDFFLKNEALILGDVLADDRGMVTRSFTKLRVMKEVAERIICFLAQLEDFQKKLWLKKKFVVETNWCLTLDRVSEEFYDELVANEAQHEEWVKLFAIDEIKNDLTGGVKYSTPLTKEFLQANPFLVLDTAFFTEDFKQRLVSILEDLDEQTDGLLIHSENFQALNLLQEKYRKSIQTTYIDPPYNTVHSEILYKNQYKHSTWLSLISNGLSLVENLWAEDFSFGIAIDDYEYIKLGAMLENRFPYLDYSNIVVNHHGAGSGGRLSRTHEYYIIMSDTDSPQYLGEPNGEPVAEESLDANENSYDEEEIESRSFIRSGAAINNHRKGRPKSFYALIFDPKTRKIVGAEHPVPLSDAYPKEDIENGLKRIYPINCKGEERVWRNSYESGLEKIKNNKLIVSDGGTVYYLVDKKSKRKTLRSNWIGTEFNAGTHGTNLLKDMGLYGAFDYPKSINTLETGLWAQSFGNTDSIVLDYFAGSATTGHAVLNLNREDGGTRKYILVEMGEYFDSVTKPRMQKVIYSKDWKDGKPVSRQGSSHCFKYIRLESYEDTLNNLILKRDDAMDSMFEENEQLHEQYLLSYMLETESRESLLSLSSFASPSNYKLSITRDSETRETSIDIVETFNYLIGLVVSHQSSLHRFDAECSSNPDGKLTLKEPLKESQNGRFAFRTVKGKTRTDEQVLVIWRERNPAVKETTDKNLEEDDVVLRAFLRTLPQEELQSYNIIYVNGDNTLMNIRENTEHWQVNLIEEAFHRLMFPQTTR